MSMLFASIFDAPDGAPSSWFQPALLPCILLFFGALTFLGGMMSDQRNMTRTPTRWVGMAILILAVFLGFTKTWHTMDPMYKALVTTFPKRWLWMHYAAFILPLLGVGVAGGMLWWEKKQKEFIGQ